MSYEMREARRKRIEQLESELRELEQKRGDIAAALAVALGDRDRAESALTEALDALDQIAKWQTSGPALYATKVAARIRSQIEGSKPIPDMFRMSRSFPEGRIEGSNDG